MDKHTLYLDFPAQRWEGASPVGNGYSGAMIFGGTQTERIQLSEERIWSSKPHAGAPKDFQANIRRLQELLLANRPGEADALAAEALKDAFESICSQETAGDIWIAFDAPDGVVSDYRRELDLLHGISRVSFLCGGESMIRETFASYPDRVIVARHTGRHNATIRYNRQDIRRTRTFDDQGFSLADTYGDCVGVDSLTIHGSAAGDGADAADLDGGAGVSAGALTCCLSGSGGRSCLGANFLLCRA